MEYISLQECVQGVAQVQESVGWAPMCLLIFMFYNSQLPYLYFLVYIKMSLALKFYCIQHDYVRFCVFRPVSACICPFILFVCINVYL